MPRSRSSNSSPFSTIREGSTKAWMTGMAIVGQTRRRIAWQSFRSVRCRFELLYDACAHHTDGLTEADITVQVCWDADRLDLGRVGMIPAPKKLCTAAAKTWDLIGWADGRAAFRVVPELVKDEWGVDLGA